MDPSLRGDDSQSPSTATERTFFRPNKKAGRKARLCHV
jgi:hypothetical protein